MQKENGEELVVKIPCRVAGPASITTKSEVDVLDFVRMYTSIPAPRVFCWSSHASNPVGAEYIIMEKAAGIPLFQKWNKMTESEKLELIENLIKLESQLVSITFPAYGGLHLRKDSNCTTNRPLSQIINPSGLFSIGATCDRTFVSESNTESDLGPWDTLSGYGISIAKREISRISNRLPNQLSGGKATFYQGSAAEQISLLETTIQFMQLLDTHPTLGDTARPTLWHTDLHMANIFVAPDDSSMIVSFIDFQSISILPAFLQAQWPVFLKPPQNYKKGLVQLELPDNFDQLDSESQTLAKMAKAYEVATYLENRPAHNAMNTPRVFRELFTRCGETSEVGVIPLRACLIEIFQSWTELGYPGHCPFSFGPDEIKAHESQFVEYQAWHDLHALVLECLDTDAEGWISPELDFEEKRRQNGELLAMYIEQSAGEKSKGEARRMWPFLED